MARPIPREAPESITTRPAGTSISDAASTISENSLIDTAVIHDVLARHIAVLRAAQESDQIAAFVRLGKAARRRALQAIRYDGLIGGVAAGGMAMEVRLQRIGV